VFFEHKTLVEKQSTAQQSLPRQRAAWIVRVVAVLLLVALSVAGTVKAQTVDVQKSLTESRHRVPPLLRLHPWRFFRTEADDALDFLNDETGLRLGISDTTIYQADPFIDTPHHTTVNTLDVIGLWSLVRSSAFGDGDLGFLFRDRTNMGPLTGNTFSSKIGLPWGVNNSGSNGYARFNQLWWQQSMFNYSLILQIGKIDEKTHFNTNWVASSDGREFLLQSLVYSQTIAFPSEGLGFNLRYWLTKQLYLDIGIADANGNPQSKPNDSLDSFFKGQYFESIECGISPELKWLWSGLDRANYRLMAWHTARTASHDGGAGFALSIDQQIPHQLVPFIRFGYSPAKINKTWVEADSGVVSLAPFGRDGDCFGVGMTWARPVGQTTQNQVAMEAFYRLEVIEGLQLTPDMELLFKPAGNPASNFEPVFGLRLRAYL
jgi:hypothetical protein